ncbi:MAG: AbrB/MazE/SpoVT family DNA-binding domain-containing protein [archaeon]|nr:AbrB/MazE/SpoVT family DNA-binding domain-containing protein [archaeon]
MIKSKVDKSGRVYLPTRVREAMGIKGEEIVEINLEKNQIVIKRREESIAKASQGIFRLRKHIKDVDAEIQKGSIKIAMDELK